MEHAELILEVRCRDYARKQGWRCWKNEKNGCKGIPDDSFLSPDGSRFLLIEFKKDARQRLRPEQRVWAEMYPKIVFRVHSYEDFVRLISPSG